jgi:hypothetical protein
MSVDSVNEALDQALDYIDRADTDNDSGLNAARYYIQLAQRRVLRLPVRTESIFDSVCPVCGSKVRNGDHCHTCGS